MKLFANLIGVLILFHGVCVLGQAVPDNSTETPQDSVAVDTTIIRWKQEKIRIIPRGVRRIVPQSTLNKVKPFTQKPPGFTPQYFWTRENIFGFNVNEVAFVNWNAGGDNSVSALANLAFVRNYKFRYLSWENELRLRYGINAQEGRALRKTEDLIRLTSTFGFRKDTLTNWFYSAKLKFNTQFSNGFNYPDRETPISRFMAPGYLFFGAGTSYILEDNSFNTYISPLTLKATYVLDEELSNRGAFGVNPGKSAFTELGFLITQVWNKEVFRNITVNHRINLYTDYIRSFGNIDIDWELNFLLKVNNFVSANIGTHIIYDDDIKFDEVIDATGAVIDPGIPRIQFKQVLGVGIDYKF